MSVSGLAARMVRWSAAHWKTATSGWLAFVVVAFALGGLAGTKSVDPTAAGPGQSGRMDRILDAGFKQPAGESVLIQSRSQQAGTTHKGPSRPSSYPRAARAVGVQPGALDK